MPEPETPPDYTAWIGRGEQSHDICSLGSASGLAALLDQAVAPQVGEPISPLGHWTQFAPSTPQAQLGADGHPRLGSFMPPLTLPRRMWAGSEVHYHSPVRIGQTLRRATTIESITPKQGGSGALCFVVLRHEILADAVPAITERQTLVYREAATGAQSSPQPPRPDLVAPEGWDWAIPHRPNETALLRYSALTFNAHRIHYDLPYATHTEGYPGLVVHGPLSATLLMTAFQEAHPAATVTAFSFSARAPIFVNELVLACGRLTSPESAELALLGPGGSAAVTATITFDSLPEHPPTQTPEVRPEETSITS